MCYLRGACRSGDLGESRVDKDGTVAKHEIQQKVRGLIWARLLIPKNSLCSSAESLMLERR
jgi:hypothetical protein